jgi:predicted DNA-binding protein (MmcQ/YjbR family)
MARARRSALLEFCRSLPHVTEDIKWGADLVFSVGGKMFAGFDKNGRDATFGCKVSEDDFPILTNVEGIRPAPYAARFSWISVDDPDVLPEAEAIALLRGSYDLVRAKLPARFRADAPTPPRTARRAAKKRAPRTPPRRGRQA